MKSVKTYLKRFNSLFYDSRRLQTIEIFRSPFDHFEALKYVDNIIYSSSFYPEIDFAII
jgi:hypothetical protein